MNAERLHAIALELQNDLGVTESPALLTQLIDALRGNDQGTAASARQQLEERLSRAPSNDFSPAWRKDVEELGVADLVGRGLLGRIIEVLQRHEITPVAAADELDPILGRLKTMSDALGNLFSALQFLEIGAEALGPGEFEVGFLIPRPAVDNGLGQLGSELVKLDKLLGPFQELTTGTRAKLEVRAISSSDFHVFLAAMPGLALVVAKTVESLLTSYQKILVIKETHESLKDSGVPKEVVQPVLDYANARMEIDIDALANQLVGQFPDHIGDQGRLNELRVDVKHSLRAMANRIDEGYSFEIRSGEISGEADEVADLSDDAKHAAEAIKEIQPRLRYLNVSGVRILELEEADDPDPS